MKSATLYLRVSTLRQAAEGVSLEAQESRARAWALANGFAVAGVHVDRGISGKRAANRPALQAALTEACAGRGVLVVYSLSRLARSTKDALAIAERLDKAGADLVSLSESIDTTSATGKLVFRILAVLAEFERDLTSERTREAMAHLRASGKRTGGDVPFGFDVAPGGRLIGNVNERATLAEIRRARAAGKTWREIAESLNARGAKTKKGRAWTWRTAQAIGTPPLKRLARAA